VRVADHSGERPAWWVLAAAALASFILHIPFLTTPLSVDEGGYGYVARWWASGADLYGDIWVDRPQGLLLLYRRTPPDARLRAAALALVAGGALGNLLDRLRSPLGVIDFIDVGIGDSRFWIFNVADIGVTVGALLLALVLWREENSAKEKA